MNELELSLTLGLKVEPEKNVVRMNGENPLDMDVLRNVFLINKLQREEMGRANNATWAELLPWHSMN